jgi:hypothetical protein
MRESFLPFLFPSKTSRLNKVALALFWLLIFGLCGLSLGMAMGWSVLEFALMPQTDSLDSITRLGWIPAGGMVGGWIFGALMTYRSWPRGVRPASVN